MGGGASKPKFLPTPPGYTSDLSSCPAPSASGNYQMILTDGKESEVRRGKDVGALRGGFEDRIMIFSWH